MAYEGNVGILRRLGAWGNLGQTKAGPNQAGGLTTSYSTNLVFNPDQYDIIYNVAFGIGTPQGLPSGYVAPSSLGLPVAVATWIWNPKGGPAPWPGSSPPPANAAVSSTNAASTPPLPGTTAAVTIPTIQPTIQPVSTVAPTPTTSSVTCPAGFILDPTGTTCIPITSAAATSTLTTPGLVMPQPQSIAPVSTSSSSSTLVFVIASGAILLGIVLFLKERKKKSAATPARKRKRK